VTDFNCFNKRALTYASYKNVVMNVKQISIWK